MRRGGAILVGLVHLSLACEGDAGQAGAPAGADAGTGLTGAEALAILQRPPFAPRQPGLFSQLHYPQGPEEVPAPASGLDDTQARALLAQTLGKRAGLAAGSASETLALLDDPGLVQLVPAASLRVALLALRGTAGDSAIATISGGAFAGVRFAPVPPAFPHTGAWVQSTGGKGTIFFADWARYGDPRTLELDAP